ARAGGPPRDARAARAGERARRAGRGGAMSLRALLADLAPALVLGPALAAAVLVGRSEAGIVVYEDGGSVVGKFGPEDVTDEELVLRSVEGQRGEMRIPRRRVRWFDPEAFRPTDAYFALH